MLMPPPIVPRRALGHVGDLAGGALGEERMAQRAAFGRHHQREEGVALVAHAVVEAQLHRLLDAVHATRRRREVLRHRAHGVARELEVGVRVGMRHLQVAHPR
jgi:hypothetical protein